MPDHRLVAHRARATRVAIRFTVLTVAAMLTSLGTMIAQAQPQFREESRQQQRIREPGFGKREFDSNCASCHGMDGKGRGPVAGFLTKNPPDLTLLSRSNGGVFPMDRLYRAIDGRDLPEGSQAGPHGNREMPIWGRDYRLRDGEYYGDTPYDADAMVRGRILALLEYLNRLQVR